MLAPLLLASNRGPLSWREDAHGEPVLVPGGGGLVSAVAGASATGDAVWVCAALSEADRRVARTTHGLVAPRVVMLDIDPVTFDRAYNGVANATLWFVAHLLFDSTSKPVFDDRWQLTWQGYRDYCGAFADALAERAAPGATVLVQDYHLALVPHLLRHRRPDLRISHFSHTPWAPPEYFALLPDDVAREVLVGMLGADALGFLAPRWASAFVRCCSQLLGAQVTDDSVTWQGRVTRVSVHALGVDGPALTERFAQPDVQGRLPALRELVGDRQLLLRIDRTELSKNIVRGLEAYRELLRTWPQWHHRVVHLAFAYPSRHDLPEYREYTAAVQRVAGEVNEEFAVDGWVPVHLEVRDDFARSLAAFSLADVLVVNPVRDGMNLVAKEGPVLSERGVSLVLSRQAGAADQLGAQAHLVNPFDVSQTAAAMHDALSTSATVRAERSALMASAATALPPVAWLQAQLDALH